MSKTLAQRFDAILDALALKESVRADKLEQSAADLETATDKVHLLRAMGVSYATIAAAVSAYGLSHAKVGAAQVQDWERPLVNVQPASYSIEHHELRLDALVNAAIALYRTDAYRARIDRALNDDQHGAHSFVWHISRGRYKAVKEAISLLQAGPPA